MTEEQAKTKWCPFAQISERNVDYIATCCGSTCMMWRVEHKEEKREGHDGGKELIFKRGVETNREPQQISYDLWVLKASGYCGLTGRV